MGHEIDKLGMVADKISKGELFHAAQTRPKIWFEIIDEIIG